MPLIGRRSRGMDLRFPAPEATHHSSDSDDVVTVVSAAGPTEVSSGSEEAADADSREENHKPHDNSVMGIELAVNSTHDADDCRDYRDNVPAFPCNRPRGQPKILDLERYKLINDRDQARMVPLLVEAVSTMVWSYDAAHLDDLLWAYGPGFTYDFVTSTCRFKVEREKGSDTVKVRLGKRGQGKWDAAVKYTIRANKSWFPVKGESVQLGRHSEPSMVDAIGIGMARGIIAAALATTPGEEVKERVKFNRTDVISADFHQEKARKKEQEYFARFDREAVYY